MQKLKGSSLLAVSPLIPTFVSVDGGRPGEPSYALNLVLLSSYPDSTKKVSDVLKLFEDGDMTRFCQEDVSDNGAPSP